MEREKIQDFKPDFALLIQAGFIAIKQLDETSARRIFQAALVINRESTAPLVGIGYIALSKLEVKEATQIFEAIVNKEPDNHLATMFLGICYLLNKVKRDVGEKLISETMEKTDDETIKNVGRVAMEWSEKDLKKLKAPFFKQEQNK